MNPFMSNNNNNNNPMNTSTSRPNPLGNLSNPLGSFSNPLGSLSNPISTTPPLTQTRYNPLSTALNSTTNTNSLLNPNPNPNPLFPTTGMTSFPLANTTLTTQSAAQLQRSQNQIYSVFRFTEALFSQQLGQYEKLLARSIILTRKQTLTQLQAQRAFVKKLNNYDSATLDRLRKRMQEIKRRNSEILKRALEFQNLIIGLAAQQGMLQGGGNVERENELYGRVSQIRRLEIQMEKRVYDIADRQGEEEIVGEDGEEVFDTEILRGFEQSLGDLGMEVMESKGKLEKMKEYLGRKKEEENRGQWDRKWERNGGSRERIRERDGL